MSAAFISFIAILNLLIYGFLILTHAQIDLHHTLLCISDMKKKRECTMRSG